MHLNWKKKDIKNLLVDCGDIKIQMKTPPNAGAFLHVHLSLDLLFSRWVSGEVTVLFLTKTHDTFCWQGGSWWEIDAGPWVKDTFVVTHGSQKSCQRATDTACSRTNIETLLQQKIEI